CRQCGEPNPHFRCAQQTCLGLALYCKACVVVRHAVLPTHWIQEWNGSFFECQSLKELKLVVQLGHPPGTGCQNPVKTAKNFVVIGVTGIHYVDLSFCNYDSRVERRQQLMRASLWPVTARDPPTCTTFAVVHLFQILSCQGKVSAHNFLWSLELLTNNDGRSPVPVPFRHIVRQYWITVIMKRAGRGHAPSGVNRMVQGKLALPCHTCPQPNLPEGWDRINQEEMPEDLHYNFFLFITQDCNFHLINRNVGSAAKNLILNDSCSYFANHKKYTVFLSSHVSEEEILSCSKLQALSLANKKHGKGLQTTGVGGTTHVRHNMRRPNGTRDPQLGEQRVWRSVLLNFLILYLILSYDIACQYGKNFWLRMMEMPKWMTFLVETAHCDKDRGVGIERYVIRIRLCSSSRGEGTVE
ncbi:hypothetical protein B0H14DRAFT_2347884, partial [Mycena olivaceomarginata]